MSENRGFGPGSGLSGLGSGSGPAEVESSRRPKGSGFVDAAKFVEGMAQSARLSTALPDFPWDTLAEAKAKAAAHPDGIVDLSVGTPVDPTPEIGQQALIRAANAAGYPTTWGTVELRQAIRDYLEERWASVPLVDDNVLPVLGTKELVAWLPTLLGLGSRDSVVIPVTAYPTYEVGARIAGAAVETADLPEAVRRKPKLIWINSPANPHGAILSPDELRAWVRFARESGAVLASDECYGEFVWEGEAVSVLNPVVNDGSLQGLLVAQSLSKRSNIAGYRAGFVAGDATIVRELLEVRKHAGMMVPTPVQAAMTVLLTDQLHVEEQADRYRCRREVIKPALEAAGFRIQDSQGSLYLWCTRDEDCRESVDFLAGLGILVAPGDFYGEAGQQFVRVGLTGTDERVAAAAARLAASAG